MGLLMGPPGTGPPSSSSSRLCVAAGLLSGFSLGRRRGSTLRATETAESLECLNRLAKESDQSWLDQLSPDPETDLHVPNTDPREVKSGHYVEVWPTPLPDPKLVIYSQEVADMLGIPEDEVRSDSFTAFFSGQRREIPVLRSWCTPYALAIMGQRMVSNCPFGNGNGYGDGRAISVGELLAHGQRFELQLKGAGRTPFCRGGDGRAVLRSSIREFLASEAMHHLGVETTRALSLVVSGSETVRRPWYADNGPAGSLYSSREPNTMVNEPCAITTRVAPSFLRVGHVDLFARRAAASPGGSAATELEQIVEHALFREYPDIAQRAEPLPERAVAMLEAFADRLAALVSGWLRVGFCQGNFNSDNCLVGGRTMDYGPFGFIDRYDPLFAKWTGSGEHYGFLNQPQAAMANYHTLVTSVAVLLKEQAKEEAVRLIEAGAQKIRAAVLDVFTKKLGFASSSEAAVDLWKELEPLLRKSKIDYTIFWHQLIPVLDSGAEDQLGHLDRAFYEPPNDELRQEWDAWLQKWAATVLSEGEGGEGARQQVASRLSAVNPKYVPREWMLVEAYTKAEKEGDYTVVQELYELFKRPYDEQPAYERYYSRGPDDVVSRGGVAYMT